MHAQKDMNTVVQNDRSTSVVANHTENVGQNQKVTVAGKQTTAVQMDQLNYIFGGQLTNVEGVCLLASATGIKLVSGKSAIEMTASGAVNITCENFNISAKNDGQINTGHVLDLNMEGGGPAEDKIEPDTGTIKSQKGNFFAGK